MALPLPDTLSPSKISRFVQCPLSFRYAYIDKLPSPPTLPQYLGTFVHSALQYFYEDSAPSDRTTERAGEALQRAWTNVQQEEALAVLAPDDAAKARFFQQGSTLFDRYFELEDPTTVEPIGIELDLRTPLENIELRGIIDRLDRLPNGDLIVIDYKTGRSPRQEFARSSMIGVQFYAFLCEQIYGQRPREVRLLYFKDRVVIVESPTDQTMRGLRQRALGVWAAIERGCESGDFRPNPTRLCNYCAYQPICPAHTSTTTPVELATKA